MRRIVLITGATSGLGYAMAAALANRQYELILTCRDPDKGAVVLQQLTSADPEALVSMLELDLSSFQSIDHFVDKIKPSLVKLDVLFNNAGLYMDVARKTVEGFEMTVGVNYIGPYNLTRRLIPLIKQGDQPQIIQMCSRAALFGRYRDRDAVFETHPHGFRAYSASKLMQLLMTIHLAKELSGVGITVNALHPGVVATGIWRGESPYMKFLAWISPKRYTPAQDAARSGLWLIENAAARVATGKFFEKQGQEIRLGPRYRDNQWIASLISRTDEAIRKNGGIVG